ncbi:MAG: sensor domain-containing diguanylate cyclase [bacterium]|nr:sensor domain-containing diguanylate cyclase [bacterium]
MKPVVSKLLTSENENDFIDAINLFIKEFYIKNLFLSLKTQNGFYFYSTFKKDRNLSETKELYDFKRIAIEEKEQVYRIDSLLYDIRVKDDVVLQSGNHYILLTDKQEDLSLIFQNEGEIYDERKNSEILEILPSIKNGLTKIYLQQKLSSEKDIEEKIATVNKKLHTLQQLTILLQSTFDFDRILDIITKAITSSLGFSVVLVSLYNEKDDSMERVAQNGLSEKVFEKLRKQKVPFSTIKNLMQERFRISKSFYINHKEMDLNNLDKTIDQIAYIIPEEKPEEYINWHPEDILIIPLYSKENKILGILTVDKPVNRYVNIIESIDILESFAQTAAISLENAKLFSKMEQLIKKLEKVSTISALMNSHIQLENLLSHFVQATKENFPNYNTSIILYNQFNELEIKTYSGYTDKYIERINEMLKMGEGIVGWVAEHKTPVHVKDTRSDPRFVGRLDVSMSEIAIPLETSSGMIGILDIESEGVNSLDENDFRIVSILASHLSISIDNTFKYEETKRIANTDPLTDMYNYRFFIEKLKEELERSKKLSIPLSILMLDIDYFKEINDNYGHMIGDLVIRDLAQLLLNTVRKGDIVTRYGGDEFFIILPGTGKQFTHSIAEKINKLVKKTNFTNGIKITVSVGTVTYPDDGDSVETLLKWVDDALYDAKRKGRDRING